MAEPVEFRVVENKMITPSVFQLTVESAHPVTFKAGQFASMIITGRGPKGRDLRRAYSIASWPEQPNLQFCIKIVENGPGSTFLRDLKAGDRLQSVVPYGDFVYKTTPDQNVCFIATGTGIAPFRSMVFSSQFQAAKPKSTWCLLGVRDEEELLYVDEFKQVPDIRFVTAVSRPSRPGSYFAGRVTDYLRLHEGELDWARTDFYLCGNGAMIDEIKKILADKGVQKPQIHQEVYYKPKA